MNMGDVTQFCFLCVIQIMQQRPRGDGADGEILQPQADQALYFKMAQNALHTGLIVKIVGVHRTDRNVQPSPHISDVHTADQKGVITDYFRGLIFHQFIHEPPQILHFRHIEIAGGHIRRRQADACRGEGDAHQVIIFALLQRLHVQIGARSDDPHHFPLYQPLCLFGILHLLADSNLVALGHQLAQIVLHRMIGYAAHGGALLQTATLSRQRDLQFSGGCQRVVKKHLIEITQPIKQYAVRILLLSLQILLHHGGQIIYFYILVHIYLTSTAGRHLWFLLDITKRTHHRMYPFLMLPQNLVFVNY